MLRANTRLANYQTSQVKLRRVDKLVGNLTLETLNYDNVGSTAVLVIACNRPTIKRSLDSIFESKPADRLPVIVSQDCEHQDTSDIID